MEKRISMVVVAVVLVFGAMLFFAIRAGVESKKRWDALTPEQLAQVDEAKKEIFSAPEGSLLVPVGTKDKIIILGRKVSSVDYGRRVVRYGVLQEIGQYWDGVADSMVSRKALDIVEGKLRIVRQGDDDYGEFCRSFVMSMDGVR